MSSKRMRKCSLSSATGDSETNPESFTRKTLPITITTSEHERLESSGDHTHQLCQNDTSESHPQRPHTSRKIWKHESSSVSTCSLDDENFVAQPLLKQRLGYLYERQKFTDVVFLVGKLEESIEAHRAILASASTTFQQLLYESTALYSNECEKYVVREPECSSESFEVFIKAMYTNEIPICLNLSMSLEVYNLTEKYCVKFLQDQIISHIHNSVTVSNVFEALKVSTSTFQLTCLVPVCWKIVEEKTSSVLEYHIETLDQSTFTRILERDQLNLEEVELFQFMVKWAASQCKRRALKTTGRNKRQMLEPFLKYIRFTNMGLTTFNDVVLPSRILEPKEIHDIITHFTKHQEPTHNSNKTTATKTKAHKQKMTKIRSSVDISKLDPCLSTISSDSAINSSKKSPSTKLRPRKNHQQKQRAKRGSLTHR